MKGALHQHAYALAAAFERLWSTPLAHLFTILVIGLSLALPTVLFRIAVEVVQVAGVEAGPPRLTVFMHVDASESMVRNLEARLNGRPDLIEVHYLSPGSALQELQRRTGLEDVLAGLDRNPLPPAFTIQARTNAPEALEALQRELKALPGVELVQLDAEWARRLYGVGVFLKKSVLVLGAVLVAGVVTLVVNTIRLQILAAREELEICKLIGASNAFVRRPFLYFGILQMLLGVAVGLAGAELARRALNQLSVQVLGVYGLHFEIQSPPPVEALLLAVLTVIIGWLAAAATVAAFLRRMRPR